MREATKGPSPIGAGPLISIIGIGPGSPISKEAMSRLDASSAILASKRLAGLFNRITGTEKFSPRVKVINDVQETVRFLKKYKEEAAVLASGDPLFYGIGRVLAKSFPPDRLEFFPAVSSVQLAFSRLGVPWEDAFFVSLHGKMEREWTARDLPLLAGLKRKLAILTGGENTPARIAKHLPPDTRVYVMERLGHPDEKMTEGRPQDISGGKRKFLEPNIMIALAGNENGPFVPLGLSENEIEHTKGLITKDEVRAAALHALALPAGGVFWDIGAGSGSVSIEAKRLCPALKVYAIEKTKKLCRMIASNAGKFRAEDIRVISGAAPDALEGLPAPCRVFIGGGGGRLPEIISHVSPLMEKGRVVITAVTVETLDTALKKLRENGFTVSASSISVARAEDITGGNTFFRALNPVFIIKGVR